MAKKITSEEQTGFSLDMDEIAGASEVKVQQPVTYTEPVQHKVKKASAPTNTGAVSCLRDTVITVRHLPQPGTISDPKHVLYGGMAENATITFTVPRLRSGVFVDVLTKDEKAFLEEVMGLEEGAMNVYNKTNNFWDNSTEGGISKVRLTKQDTQLHLNNPIEYIYYKILLANKNQIAPDLQTLADRPKATYKFVLISNNDVNTVAKSKMSTKMQCYVEYGKIENNPEILRAVIEIITAKPIAGNTKLEFLQTKAGELIEADAKIFLNVVKDPLLPTRVLIKKAVEQGFISKKGDWYYLRSDNTPLCEGGEEPTMTSAARYLANPKRQQMKLSLEAQVK